MYSDKSGVYDMKSKNIKDRLEDKLHFYYSNYGKNGYTFEDHMPFEQPPGKLTILQTTK